MRVLVKKSNIEGLGVFAKEDIKKDTLIYIMEGKKISIPCLKSKYDSRNVRIDDPFQISDRAYLLLKKPGIYFNHSCNPSAGIQGTGKVIARRNIPAGEEVTIDYSTTEWTDDKAWGINWRKLWKIPCTCGSKKCRKTIRIFPAIPKRIQRKYYEERMLPDFIMRKIKRANPAQTA